MYNGSEVITMKRDLDLLRDILLTIEVESGVKVNRTFPRSTFDVCFDFFDIHYTSFLKIQ